MTRQVPGSSSRQQQAPPGLKPCGGLWGPGFLSAVLPRLLPIPWLSLSVSSPCWWRKVLALPPRLRPPCLPCSFLFLNGHAPPMPGKSPSEPPDPPMEPLAPGFMMNDEMRQVMNTPVMSMMTCERGKDASMPSIGRGKKLSEMRAIHQ